MGQKIGFYLNYIHSPILFVISKNICNVIIQKLKKKGTLCNLWYKNNQAFFKEIYIYDKFKTQTKPSWDVITLIEN